MAVNLLLMNSYTDTGGRSIRLYTVEDTAKGVPDVVLRWSVVATDVDASANQGSLSVGLCRTGPFTFLAQGDVSLPGPGHIVRSYWTRLTVDPVTFEVTQGLWTALGPAEDLYGYGDFANWINGLNFYFQSGTMTGDGQFLVTMTYTEAHYPTTVQSSVFGVADLAVAYKSEFETADDHPYQLAHPIAFNERDVMVYGFASTGVTFARAYHVNDNGSTTPLWTSADTPAWSPFVDQFPGTRQNHRVQFDGATYVPLVQGEYAIDPDTSERYWRHLIGAIDPQTGAMSGPVVAGSLTGSSSSWSTISFTRHDGLQSVIILSEMGDGSSGSPLARYYLANIEYAPDPVILITAFDPATEFDFNADANAVDDLWGFLTETGFFVRKVDGSGALMRYTPILGTVAGDTVTIDTGGTYDEITGAWSLAANLLGVGGGVRVRFREAH